MTMAKMKFYGCVDDGHPRELEAADAEDAAEELAERYHLDGGESPKEDESLRVTVIGPDGAITVHDVVAQTIVVYRASKRTDEPDWRSVKALHRVWIAAIKLDKAQQGGSQ